MYPALDGGKSRMDPEIFISQNTCSEIKLEMVPIVRWGCFVTKFSVIYVHESEIVRSRGRQRSLLCDRADV